MKGPGPIRRPLGHGTIRRAVRGGALLYFAYDANMEPTRLSAAAPGAEFRFIAHLPEWRLHFPIPNGEGGLPSVKPECGNCVWGAVFSLDDRSLAKLNARQAEEGRIALTAQAMDREGHRHQVVVHVCQTPDGEHPPARQYLQMMVVGSRHWHLPAGWVASLQEHLDEP